MELPSHGITVPVHSTIALPGRSPRFSTSKLSVLTVILGTTLLDRRAFSRSLCQVIR